MKKVLLEEFTGHEAKELLAKADKVTAICSFGALEGHGWHSCLAPDTIVPTEVAKRVAQRLDNVVVVPCVPFGTSMMVSKHPMAITLRHKTVIAIAEDIFESLIANGIKRIYILNGHGGNTSQITIAAAKVKDRHPEARILHLAAWWATLAKMMGDKFEVWSGLGHGGEGETSIVMAIRPDLIDLAKAEAQVPEKVIKLSEKVGIVYNMAEVSKTGAIGDPTKATVEKGKMMLDALVDLVAGTIEEMNRTNWDYR